MDIKAVDKRFSGADTSIRSSMGLLLNNYRISQLPLILCSIKVCCYKLVSPGIWIYKGNNDNMIGTVSVTVLDIKCEYLQQSVCFIKLLYDS